MDDLQFWLYVILGVVYLISQIRKKSKQQQNLPPEKPIQRETPSSVPQWNTESKSTETKQKPISFEELLREITEAKSTKSSPEYEPYKQPEYIDYDDNIEDEIHDLEDVNVDHTKSSPVFEQYSKSKYSEYSGYADEKSQKLESVDMKFGKFKEFEIGTQTNLLDLYLGELRGPEGLKKAVIMNEVLNPKYF